jgi:hypothetical protein
VFLIIYSIYIKEKAQKTIKTKRSNKKKYVENLNHFSAVFFFLDNKRIVK